MRAQLDLKSIYTQHKIERIIMNKEPRSQTYHRIIDAGLQLFNEHGERNISTNHIATHLGISPGNLYYHFANKDEIIAQLFKRYCTRILGYLNETPLPQSVESAVEYMRGIYQIIWDYRFLFSDLNTLLNRSATMIGKHNEFTHERIEPLLLKLLEQFQTLGMICIDERGMRDLSFNMWLITKYWLDFDSSVYGSGKITQESIERGIYRTLSLLRPYWCEPYLQQFDEIMSKT